MSAASFTRSTVSVVNLPPREPPPPRARSGAGPLIWPSRSEPRLLRQRQALEGGDAEAIRHPGYVIGDPLDLVGARGALRDLLGMIAVVVEQAPKRAVDPLVLAARLRAQIDPLEHELAHPRNGSPAPPPPDSPART